MPPFSFISCARQFLPALFLAACLAQFSHASTVPVLTPEKIDEMLARLQPGEDTVYVDDMGFKASYLMELRDQLRKLRDSKDGEVTVNSGFLSSALTQWTYRARYRVGDIPVRLWSAEASVVVGVA